MHITNNAARHNPKVDITLTMFIADILSWAVTNIAIVRQVVDVYQYMQVLREERVVGERQKKSYKETRRVVPWNEYAGEG